MPEVVCLGSCPARKVPKALKAIVRVKPANRTFPTIERRIQVPLPICIEVPYSTFRPKNTSDEHDVGLRVRTAIVKISSYHSCILELSLTS
jgi:hypothetical protein